mmetsp:Transcript_11214/g.27571  ORF Transcript_11214/g.27571 Transcript_11214/m.27571 type:complete len:173 (+) Transcript_11214:339-857(+)
MVLQSKLPQSTLFILPLVPSVICMALSLCGMVVIDVADYSNCDDKNGESLQAFVIGSMILGYMYSFYHGLTMVGPDWISKKLSVFTYLIHAIIVLGWCIFGSVAVASVSDDCKRSPLWGMGVAYLPLYYVMSLLHIAFGVFGFVQGFLSAGNSRTKPKENSEGNDDSKNKDA